MVWNSRLEDFNKRKTFMFYSLYYKINELRCSSDIKVLATTHNEKKEALINNGKAPYHLFVGNYDQLISDQILLTLKKSCKVSLLAWI